MATSSGTALRRLLQSDACDHHHAEYANGFHSLLYDSMSPPANWTIYLLRIAPFGNAAPPNLPFLLAATPLTP
jgi:hypothetical protein